MLDKSNQLVGFGSNVNIGVALGFLRFLWVVQDGPQVEWRQYLLVRFEECMSPDPQLDNSV